ncbi:extracellular tyrosine-protein kinase PKDCC-like [Anneissia japonica]|uniref:extracellular tyrosine-protein kinase PKDCC-like n=1 Tax=Anneissia japonica TaxID=1529436 RepID=UPI0014258BDF|nr:extracellular tyrosine-protein kinase PKDCC-like [Anneissia japonica]
MLLFVLTALFVVESILFLPILQWNTNGQSSLPTRSRQERESKIKHAMFRHQLIQEKRNRTKYIRVDSTSLHLPKHLLPLKKSSNTWFSNNASQMLHCEDILEISLVKRIGKGTTKEVWKATYQQKEVAVKLVSKSVDDIRTCMKRVQADEEERRRCYTYANYKLMKEISLLLDLQHSNIIKILGYCILQDESIFGDDHSIVSVVEIGERITRKKVLGMSWTKRMQVRIKRTKTDVKP